MALQNAPTPSLIYPKSGVLYLMSRVQELTANVTDLIQTLAGKDQVLAQYEAIFNDPDELRKRISELESGVTAIPPANGMTDPKANGAHVE